MQIAINEAGSTATVTLTGRLDITGAEVVALPLATLSGNKTNLIINMAGVTFVASIGLRHLVMSAKAVGRKGGRLVLLNPNVAVAEVVTTSGLADLLQIEHSTAPKN
jgi:anti-sigma B factor antagonist